MTQLRSGRGNGAGSLENKPHDESWNNLLTSRGLAVVVSILEDYGVSCEVDVSHLDAEDLNTLGSKLKPLQSKLLRKWVEGLAAGGHIVITGQSCLAHQQLLRDAPGLRKAGKNHLQHHQCHHHHSCHHHHHHHQNLERMIKVRS